MCDGYGVWGGGGNFYGHRQSVGSALVCCPSTYIAAFGESPEEREYFDWFKCRTSKKIPGAFVLKFWDTLLFQASWNEPAVLQAVLTLSAVHKTDTASSGELEPIPDAQEQFMLQHYSKAIRHLQPLFTSKGKASIRTALITCVVFVSLELLRGRFRTAQTHLEAGLKVLRESEILRGSPTTGFFIDQAGDPVDLWIMEIFSRLHAQFELFRRTYRHPCLFLHSPRLDPPRTVFHTFKEAWQPLEQLLGRILWITEQRHQQQVSSGRYGVYSDVLSVEQQDIQDKLTQWLTIYQACREDLSKQYYAALVCLLLESYHTMATIMAGTCLWIEDESIYDSFTDDFMLLLRQSADMWLIGSPHTRAQSGSAFDMSRSMVDLGWIPLLYYIAVKCRIHRVRLQAIRFLESASHREGIWDSRIAARVAQRVMVIEERGFYEGLDIVDDFPLDAMPKSQDLRLPTLPSSYRIDELLVELSDEPEDSVVLHYRQKQTGEEWRMSRVSISSRD